MLLDIYRRPEPGLKTSYLAVPAGRLLPPEVVSIEWTLHTRAVERDEDAPAFDEYGIRGPGEQLRAKGYAITDLAHQLPASVQHAP